MDTTREYFYSIDGKGRLFHDGTELTDEKFLNFFLKRLRANDTGRHAEFPFISPCGREMNYVQCADSVVVFHRLQDNRLYYGPELYVDFEPLHLRFTSDGRLYHPAPVGRVGAVAPGLLMEFASNLRPWGPYYALEFRGRTHIIEPVEPDANTAHLRLIRPRAENGCFGCGGSHNGGLALSFLFNANDRSTRSWFTPDERLQGASGWMHGGFVSLLLDEIMAKVLTGLDVSAPTVNLNVDFRKPCRLGRDLELRGRLLDVQGRKHTLRGEVFDVTDVAYGDADGAGVLLAEAEGLFLKIEGRPGVPSPGPES